MIGTIRYKILLMGDPYVGKTTLREKFMGKKVADRYEMTIGVDISEKTMEFGDYRVKLHIFDIAGQKRFEYLHDLFFLGSNGGLMVFDVTNSNSFKRSILWIKRYWSLSGSRKPIVLIANKVDLEDKRVVMREHIEEFARALSEKCKCEIPYFETSALRGINVEEAFYELIKLIIKYEMKIDIKLDL